MKIKLLLLVPIIYFACACSDDANNFGKTDCYWEITEELDRLEEIYQDEKMNYVDEDGYVQSTKVCRHQRDATIIYASGLEQVRYSIHNESTTLCSDSSLTGEELLELDARIRDRIIDLEKAVDPEEGVYNCDS